MHEYKSEIFIYHITNLITENIAFDISLSIFLGDISERELHNTSKQVNSLLIIPKSPRVSVSESMSSRAIEIGQENKISLELKFPR